MEELQRLVKEGQWEKAFALIEQLEPEQRNCFEVLYALAKISLHYEQYSQAQDFLSRCGDMCEPHSAQMANVQALQEEIQDRQRPNRKVLMAAYYFPPLAGSGVYRSIKFAKYLPEYRWTPVVVSTDKPPQGWNFSDDSLVKEIPRGMEVHRVPDPMNHAKSIDISYAQKVVGFLQFVLEDHPQAKQLLAKFLQQEKGLETMFQFPCHALAWAYEAARFVETSLDFQSMDVIYTTSGPYSAHLIGYYFKKKYGMPWVADFRDEWVNNPYAEIDLKQAAHKLLYDLEELILQYADYSLTISEEAVKNYIRTFSIPKEKIISITNGYDEWDFRNISFPKEKNPQFTISYIGLLYTQQRNMSPIFMAVHDLIQERKMDSSKIRFHVMGSSDKDNLNLAKQYGLENHVEITGYSPHTQALQSCINSDLLLLFVGDTPHFKGVYTGKVFEYLRCGKPILALAPKGGVVDQILKETGHGKAMLSSEKKAIKQFILQQYQLWECARENTYLASQQIQQYERKHLTGKLSQIFSKIEVENREDIPDKVEISNCRTSQISSLEEFPSMVYDLAYSSGGAGGSYHKHYTQSFYYPSWLSILPYFMLLDRSTSILDIGCGVGQFANLLFDHGFHNYKGLDFSGEAIHWAKKQNPKYAHQFFQGDAFQSDLFAGQYDLVIMFEILEHINQDLELIDLVRSGTKMLLSVPNFPDTYHVRYFKNMKEVTNRYQKTVNIYDTKTFSLTNQNRLFYIVGEKK